MTTVSDVVVDVVVVVAVVVVFVVVFFSFCCPSLFIIFLFSLFTLGLYKTM